MLEKEIERYLVDKVEIKGGMTLKFVSPRWNGIPDRLILMPNGMLFFAELKAPERNPRKLQLLRHEQIREVECMSMRFSTHEYQNRIYDPDGTD